MNESDNFYYIADYEYSCESLEDAINHIFNYSKTFEDAQTKVIEKHEKRQCKHSEFIDGESILEHIAERAYDNHGDYAEDYLGDLMSDKDKVLELEKLITNFIENNSAQPTFYESSKLMETISITPELFAQFGLVFEVAQ